MRLPNCPRVNAWHVTVPPAGWSTTNSQEQSEESSSFLVLSVFLCLSNSLSTAPASFQLSSLWLVRFNLLAFNEITAAISLHHNFRTITIWGGTWKPFQCFLSNESNKPKKTPKKQCDNSQTPPRQKLVDLWAAKWHVMYAGVMAQHSSCLLMLQLATSALTGRWCFLEQFALATLTALSHCLTPLSSARPLGLQLTSLCNRQKNLAATSKTFCCCWFGRAKQF